VGGIASGPSAADGSSALDGQEGLGEPVVTLPRTGAGEAAEYSRTAPALLIAAMAALLSLLVFAGRRSRHRRQG
jgi:hypothetical protein